MKYEEYLNQYGKLTYRNVGTSMLPLLKQGRDLFTVEKKKDERCKKYDVILYKRPSGQYVIHRVIRVRRDDYVILGDHCIKKEYGIRDENVLGVMTSFIRKGKKISTSNRLYRLYSRIWLLLYPIRFLYSKCR